MNITNYLVNIYGYDTPIFLKNIRIGGKSKTAIKQELYRAVKSGELNRDGPGVYSVANKTGELLGAVTFEKIVESKFVYTKNYIPEAKEIFIIGYYTGMTFLNMIGISDQVPAVLEITTNNTSSKKRIYSALGRRAIIRKGKTEINFINYKVLQFLDMFHWLSVNDVKKNKKIIIDYMKENKISFYSLTQYKDYYGFKTLKKLVEGGIINGLLQ